MLNGAKFWCFWNKDCTLNLLMGDHPRHIPVLQKEVLQILSPREGETVLDCTLGAGGHAKLFLQKIGPKGKLIGLDADQKNFNIARENLFPLRHQCTFFHENFRNIDTLDLPPLDIIFADLGISSMHIDDPMRGFSFRHNVPLDLRFNREKGTLAREWIRESSEEQIVHVFKDYGQCPHSRKLARLLKENNVQTNEDVVSCAHKIFGWRAKRMLPQIFQALRIAVNDEIGSLEILLQKGLRLLQPGGRMGVISFHSLEDRAVKHVFRTLTTSKYDAPFTLLTKKPIRPSEKEVQQNPRSRSALLRAIERTPF